MIDKQTAKQHNLNIIDNHHQLDDKKKALIEQLKTLLPNVINSDNQLDTKALNDVLDLANTTANNQGYEMTFAGKGIAKANASSPTDYELKAEVKQSKNFDKTDNVVIRGDNLEVLKILQANYHQKIKMIYIDPPYNTKNENFIYKDNFKKSDEDLIEQFGLNEETADFLNNVYGTRSHSGWLSFMYPRLKLARDLLTDDGVIFISIDDNEQANLKILCDEIFGEDNFVGQFVIQTNPRGRQLDKFVAKTFEYIVLYSKNSLETKIFEIQKSDKTMLEYNLKDEKGDFRLLELRNRGSSQFNRKTRPNLYYPIYIDIEKNTISLMKNHDFTEMALPINSKNEDGCWTWSKDKVLNNLDFLFPRKTKTGIWRIFRKDYVPKEGATSKEKSLWIDKNINNENGKERVTQLIGGGIFDFPKSVSLIQKVLKISSKSNDLILDFFAGSGTTGDAVMQLNAQDGGNRKFILVQLDEAIDKKKSIEAYKFCTDNNFKPVISSITIERLNRAGAKIKADLANKQKSLFDDKKLPDIGYKVFATTPKPSVKQAKNKPGEFDFSVVNNRLNTLDTLANMLVATCKTLDAKIECIVVDVLYKADDELYLLDDIKSDLLKPYEDLKINLDGWAQINLTQYLNLGVGQKDKKDNIHVIY